MFKEHYRNLYYAIQEWKCRNFGHNVFIEIRAGTGAHTLCKRGCGPVNNKWDPPIPSH